jgi:cell division septum initiation protein DivIVA
MTTDDNNIKYKNDIIDNIINDLSILQDLYDKLVLENKNLKERLNRYTNSNSKKSIQRKKGEK